MSWELFSFWVELELKQSIRNINKWWESYPNLCTITALWTGESGSGQEREIKREREKGEWKQKASLRTMNVTDLRRCRCRQRRRHWRRFCRRQVFPRWSNQIAQLSRYCFANSGGLTEAKEPKRPNPNFTSAKNCKTFLLYSVMKRVLMHHIAIVPDAFNLKKRCLQVMRTKLAHKWTTIALQSLL